MGAFTSGLFSGTLGSPQLRLSDQETDITMVRETVPGEASKRESLLKAAQTEEARRIIKELYREGAEVGDGGTADAIREELASNEPVGGRSHVQKGKERLKQIEKLLRRNPDHADRALLEELRDDLKNALKGQ